MMNKQPGRLTPGERMLGMAVKILLGILYGYIFLHYYHGDDTWKIHNASLEETTVLLSDPARFFREEFTPLLAMHDTDKWQGILVLYLHDLEYAFTVKLLAIVNLLTRGNYYLNTVFFNLVVFLGHCWLFQALRRLFPSYRKPLFITIFLFFPVVFWLSGIRGDGILFLFFALLLKNMAGTGRGAARWIYIIIGMAGVLIFRPGFALLLAPAVAGYFLSVRFPRRPVTVFAAVYTTAAVLFFTSMYVMPQKGFPGAVAEKQAHFFNLSGTAYRLDTLDTSARSFAAVMPQALNNTLLRPYPWEAAGALQLFSAAEVIVFWLVVALAIAYRPTDWRKRLSHPVILMLACYSLSAYLFIGYTVPFPGAIVRYKTIPELLLLCCTVVVTDWKRINYIFK